MTDVIQQLLELSEQVSGEAAQPQAPGPAITMDTAINQDILQVSEGLSAQCQRSSDGESSAFFSPFHLVASSGKQRAECGPATGRHYIQRAAEPDQ